MERDTTARALMGLTIAASAAAAAAAFWALYRLRDDPLAGLGSAYEIAALLQPVPYAAAVGLAVAFRRRHVVLVCVLAMVILCGAYGAWWLAGLEGVRQVENQPVRRNALGNIAPDIEGEIGAAEAFGWPIVVAGLVGGAALVARLATRGPAGRPAPGTRRYNSPVRPVPPEEAPAWPAR